MAFLRVNETIGDYQKAELTRVKDRLSELNNSHLRVATRTLKNRPGPLYCFFNNNP